jgi:chemotaxis protein methyltransferase CheR
VTLPAADFEYIRELVHRRAAIVLESNKGYLAISRLEPLAHSVGLRSVSDLVTRLRSDPNSLLHEQVVEAMTTNETSFFRDLYPFESLRTHILPAIIERNRGGRAINIWSAGCASGQEPYSLAMLIKEDFPELDSWSVSILATDVAAAVLERARTGRFAQIEMNRGLPAHLHVKYFHRQGSQWEIDASIRQRVRFERHNLVTPWPGMPAMDLVFLRNVLIYFDHATKESILRRMREVLRPHGYLLLGASETTLNIDGGFERHPLGRTVWYTKRPSAASSG